MCRTKIVGVLDHHVRCFVLTSMDRQTFEAQLDDLQMRDYFEATYSGVLDKRHVIGELIDTHDLHLEHTAFVGDMIHDVVTAKHGGVSSIAVLTGYTHHDVLATASPDWILEDLAALQAMMNDAKQDNSDE